MFGQHMKLRWWQRGDGKNKRLDIAWQEAEPVKILGRKAAEARYHFDSNSVLIRKTEAVVLLSKAGMALSSMTVW